MLLHAEGYKVLSASDGETALALLESTSVDLVLLDLEMPGKAGDTLCHDLRDLGLCVRVLIVSGKQAAPAVTYPIVGIIGKTEGPRVLIERIKEILSAPDARVV